MQLKKATTVLVVKEVEPCLDFWTERLGFDVTARVPEGDRLGFAILVGDGVEIMYQSEASVANDIPPILAGKDRALRATLMIEVDSADEIDERLAGVPRVIPRRKTFYGADEVIVADPAGNVLIFAEMTGAQA
jgi:uncharacterized glyoxalase superfamily protein PhnB